MIERAFSAERYNEIVNDPSILPWVKGKHERLDVGPILANKQNILLMGEHGGVLAIQLQPALYEIHTSVLPEGRGEWAQSLFDEVARWLFCRTPAIELLTKCPQGNVAAHAGARAVGAKLDFTTRPIWPIEGELVPVDVFSLPIQRWMARAPGLATLGARFHRDIQRAIPAHEHPQDQTHDQYVGMVVAMIEGGSPRKGVAWYNRWAKLSDYATIAVELDSPLIINIGDARLLVNDDLTFEVL